MGAETHISQRKLIFARLFAGVCNLFYTIIPNKKNLIMEFVELYIEYDYKNIFFVIAFNV